MKVILINGTYGVGKTSVARELRKLITKEKSEIIELDEIFQNFCENNPNLILTGRGAFPQNNLNVLKEAKNRVEMSEKEYLIFPQLVTEKEAIEFFKEYDLIHCVLFANLECLKERINNDEGREEKDLALRDIELNYRILNTKFNNVTRIDTSDKEIIDIAKEIFKIVKENEKCQN